MDLGESSEISKLSAIFLTTFVEAESQLGFQVKHISHKLIDSLSDGVFSIALTLLGLDVVALVHKISESEDFNATLFEHWPTFLAYVLGFVVLFSWWYQSSSELFPEPLTPVSGL